MQIKTLILFAMLLLLASCMQTPTTETTIPNVPGEVLYNPIFSDSLAADEIVVMGVRIGDTEEFVRSLHGDPDHETEFQFGRVKNFEYNFTENQTAVLYNINDGKVEGILLTSAAQNFIQDTRGLGSSRTELYETFGQPTLIRPLNLQTAYIYDELGYEVYMQNQVVRRIFLTQPNRGIQRPGVDEQECALQVTAALNPDTQECLLFPTECDVPNSWTKVDSCQEIQPQEQCLLQDTAAVNPETQKCTVFDSTCDVPEEWEIVESCDSTDNTAPVLCIQVITPAMNPETNECVDFPTPCDVPEGWESCE